MPVDRMTELEVEIERLEIAYANALTNQEKGALHEEICELHQQLCELKMMEEPE